jgi:hypothetical protein
LASPASFSSCSSVATSGGLGFGRRGQPERAVSAEVRERIGLRDETRRMREEMRSGFADLKVGFARIEATFDRRCTDLVQCWFALWCATVALIVRTSSQHRHLTPPSYGSRIRSALLVFVIAVGLALVAFATISEDEL